MHGKELYYLNIYVKKVFQPRRPGLGGDRANQCRSTAVTGSQTGGGSSGSGNGATGSSDGGSGASSAQNVLDEFQRQLANLPA